MNIKIKPQTEHIQTLSPPITVLFRGTSHRISECFCKITCGAKPTLFRNFQNAQVALHQEADSHPEAVTVQALIRRSLYTATETARAFPCADAGRCGNILKSHLISIMLMDELHHGLDPLSIGIFARLRACPQLPGILYKQPPEIAEPCSQVKFEAFRFLAAKLYCLHLCMNHLHM